MPDLTARVAALPSSPTADSDENPVVPSDRASREAESRRTWEDDVLTLVMLGVLAGDSRHALPVAAPRTWNAFGHLGFRRIFLSDEWPSTDTSLVIMFSLEDEPHIVLATRFPLQPGSLSSEEVAKQIGKEFVRRIRGAPARVDPQGDRLQWL